MQHVPESSTETATLTSKGRVTVPKAVRRQLGLRKGTRVTFVVEGDHAVLRAAVPPDFDVAGLRKPVAPR